MSKERGELIRTNPLKEQELSRVDEVLLRLVEPLPFRLQHRALLLGLYASHGISPLRENCRGQLNWQKEEGPLLPKVAVNLVNEDIARYKLRVAGKYAELRKRLDPNYEGCNLDPSCSEYAAMLFQRHGLDPLTLLIAWRRVTSPLHNLPIELKDPVLERIEEYKVLSKRGIDLFLAPIAVSFQLEYIPGNNIACKEVAQYFKGKYGEGYYIKCNAPKECLGGLIIGHEAFASRVKRDEKGRITDIYASYWAGGNEGGMRWYSVKKFEKMYEPIRSIERVEKKTCDC